MVVRRLRSMSNDQPRFGSSATIAGTNAAFATSINAQTDHIFHHRRKPLRRGPGTAMDAAQPNPLRTARIRGVNCERLVVLVRGICD